MPHGANACANDPISSPASSLSSGAHPRARSQPHASPELLAPAGGPDALARRGRQRRRRGLPRASSGSTHAAAPRTSRSTALAEACRFAHLRGVRVYLTANVVVLPRASSPRRSTWSTRRGRQASTRSSSRTSVCLRAVRRALPHVRVHASTQINAHNTLTVAGTRRARRLAGDARARGRPSTRSPASCAASGVEVESFVHGALCVCYSGQCLMSSLIGRRSANRGLCAQPCRLPYELVDATGTVLDDPGCAPAVTQGPRRHRGAARADRGRRRGAQDRGPHEERRVRRAGDRRLPRGARPRAADPGHVSRCAMARLAVLGESFSRGFTEAYLVGERGNDMMSYQRPNNRGVPVGRVAATASGRGDDRARRAARQPRTPSSSGRRRAVSRSRPGRSSTRAPSMPSHRRASGHRRGRALGHHRRPGLSRAQRRALGRCPAHVLRRARRGAPLAFDGAPRRRRAPARRRHRRAGPARASATASRRRARTHQGRHRRGGRRARRPARRDAVLGRRLGPRRCRPTSESGSRPCTASAARRSRPTRHALLEPWARPRARVAAACRGRAPRRAPKRRPPASWSRRRTTCDGPRVSGGRGRPRPRSGRGALRAASRSRPASCRCCRASLHDREVAAALRWCATGRARWSPGISACSREAARRGAVVEAHWSLNAVNAYAVEQLADLGAEHGLALA